MLKNRYILTILSSIAFCTIHADRAEAAGITNIVSTSGAVIQQLSHDWNGQAAASPVGYSFIIEGDDLVFYAGQSAPVTIHPDARPGKFQAELWKYDTAEFFIADASEKKYMEFNLCPNGAWWACAFYDERQQWTEMGVPDGVETTASMTNQGWVSSARIPLAYLEKLKIDIKNCRLATASILNSPVYKYYTTASNQTGEPNFHSPDNWAHAVIKDATGKSLNLSRNQSRFYGAVQSMKAAGAATPALSWLSILSEPEQAKAMINTMSGHEYATAMSSQMEGNLAHLARLRAAMGKGAMLGAQSRVPTSAEGYGIWRAGVSTFHDETNIDTDARGDGYDRSETGAMLNAEYVTGENLTLGGAISYGRTNLRTEGAMRRHEDNTRFDLYALYGCHGWSFATSIGLGIHDHELKRRLAHTRADGYAFNFMQDAAYTVVQNDKNTLQIFGTVETGRNHMCRFNDGLLSGAAQNAWATDVTMGTRYSRTLPSVCNNAPAGAFTAQTGVTASIGDVQSELDLSMHGYTYRQESAKRNRWGWNLSAGVDVPVHSNVSVYGAAEAILRGDSQRMEGQIGVRVAF